MKRALLCMLMLIALSSICNAWVTPLACFLDNDKIYYKFVEDEISTLYIDKINTPVIRSEHPYYTIEITQYIRPQTQDEITSVTYRYMYNCNTLSISMFPIVGKMYDKHKNLLFVDRNIGQKQHITKLPAGSNAYIIATAFFSKMIGQEKAAPFWALCKKTISLQEGK